MEKSIKIGIFAPNFALLEIINQIGISFEIVSNYDTISITKFSVIIVNQPLNKKEFALIKDYISNGGAIIDFGYCIDRIINGTLKKERLKYIIPKDIPFIPIFNCIDIYTSSLTFSKAQYLDKSLFIDSYGQGLIAFLGMDINSLFLNIKSKRKEFYSHSSSAWFPNEEVSLVSKGEIVLLLFYLLKYLHCKRNLPFIHKWFFPNEAENVFLFRIDSDYGSQKQIRQWFELSQIHKIKYTWFLHTEAHKEWLPFFGEFKNHELAVHGHKHYFSKISNEKNIKTACDLIKKNGLFSKGYAAPYGLWNERLHNTCEKLGFLYTSEFSYIYDSTPLRPVFSNRISSVVQIPVHPICIGSLINAKMKDEAIVRYYTAVLEKKRMNYSPLIFYDHVLHHIPSVLKHLFEKISSYSIPSLTFLDYATWWNKRMEINHASSVNGHNNININLSKENKDVFLCVWINDNEFFLTNKNGIMKISTMKINRQIQYTPDIIPEKLQMTRTFNPRLFKISMLNQFIWRRYT